MNNTLPLLPLSRRKPSRLHTALTRLPLALMLACGLSMAAATPSPTISPPAPAQQSSRTNSAVDAATYLPGALFRIEKNHHAAWLYGTIHMGQPGLLNNSTLLKKTLDQAQGLVLETKAGLGDDPKADAELGKAMNQLSGYPPGHSALDDLSPKTLQDLTTLFRGDKQSLDKTLQIRPWLTAMIMEIQVMESIGLEAKDGVDKQIYTHMKARKKPLFGLEDGVQSIHLFSDAPGPIQGMMLQNILDDLGKPFNRTDLAAMLKNWRDGNLDQMWLDAMRKDNDELEPARLYVKDVIILKRNKAFSESIDQLVSKHDNLFIGIGMLHLAGPDSTITLLKQRGYKVTRIMPPPGPVKQAAPAQPSKWTPNEKSAPVTGAPH